MVEEWRDIKNYEGWYQVSNLGRVKRLKKRHCTNGKVVIVEKEHIMTPQKNGDGYYRVKLSNNGDVNTTLVSRLVANAFVPNPKPMLFNIVDHKDRDRSNNVYTNLRWTNVSGNSRNRITNKTLTYNGVTKAISDWSDIVGISISTLCARIRYGWDVEDILFKPIDTKYYHKTKKEKSICR